MTALTESATENARKTISVTIPSTMPNQAGRSLVRQIKETLYPWTSRYFSNATLIRGKLKDSETTLTCMFVHNCLYNESLVQRTFSSSEVVQKWRVFLPALQAFIKRHKEACDLCVAVVPRELDAQLDRVSDFRGTEEVRQVISTRGSWDDIRSKFTKKKKQTTNDFENKHGLSYRITTAPADLHLFYHDMHVPHINRRYGSLSDIDSFETTEKFFRKGLLLLVIAADKPVAGALSHVENNQLVFRRSGVLDGDESHVKGGAQTALYYFQLRYAADHGVQAVDAMNSSPFLNDGVFRHKADWGATTLPDADAKRSVHFVLNAPAPVLCEFFRINPVITNGTNGLIAVVGATSAENDPIPAFDEIKKKYHLDGLAGVSVYTNKGRSQHTLP